MLRPALSLLALSLLLAGCRRADGNAAHKPDDVIVVFNAGSLARPLRAALDTFSAREHVRVEQESGGSLETARKLTAEGRIPDLIALADYELFPHVLMPSPVAWYARFARNRMVLAYTDRSRHASEIDSTNWWRILTTPGVRTGRADPSLDPNGYRVVIVLRLAERHYGQPGLADRALASSAPYVWRPGPGRASLPSLLQDGKLDYMWSYESSALSSGQRFVRLPGAIDLGEPADSAEYARASVRVPGRTPSDSVTFRGEPVVYGLSIPIHPPHPRLAERFAAFLFSDAGRRIMRREHLDVLDRPVLIGTGIPASLRQGGR